MIKTIEKFSFTQKVEVNHHTIDNCILDHLRLDLKLRGKQKKRGGENSEQWGPEG